MTREIRKSMEISAPADVVFKALTDENEIVQWFAYAGAKFDARNGGEVEIKTRKETGEIFTARGRV